MKKNAKLLQNYWQKCSQILTPIWPHKTSNCGIVSLEGTVRKFESMPQSQKKKKKMILVDVL